MFSKGRGQICTKLGEYIALIAIVQAGPYLTPFRKDGDSKLRVLKSRGQNRTFGPYRNQGMVERCLRENLN